MDISWGCVDHFWIFVCVPPKSFGEYCWPWPQWLHHSPSTGMWINCQEIAATLNSWPDDVTPEWPEVQNQLEDVKQKHQRPDYVFRYLLANDDEKHSMIWIMKSTLTIWFAPMTRTKNRSGSLLWFWLWFLPLQLKQLGMLQRSGCQRCCCRPGIPKWSLAKRRDCRIFLKRMSLRIFEATLAGFGKTPASPNRDPSGFLHIEIQLHIQRQWLGRDRSALPRKEGSAKLLPWHQEWDACMQMVHVG